MIVAIEGPSAAGKTSWCRSHYPDQHVVETPENIAAPDLFSIPEQVAAFWVDHAIHNWRRALEIEQQHGLAVCDGDPFHLYFAWALWKSGALARDLFNAETELYRNALARRQIGFVDHVLWIELGEEELRRRALADTTRRRKRHTMYLALVPWMKIWFEAREAFTPGTVHSLREDVRVGQLIPRPDALRYSALLLDQILATL